MGYTPGIDLSKQKVNGHWTLFQRYFDMESVPSMFKIHLQNFQFTRIAMTKLNVWFLGYKISFIHTITKFLSTTFLLFFNVKKVELYTINWSRVNFDF